MIEAGNVELGEGIEKMINPLLCVPNVLFMGDSLGDLCTSEGIDKLIFEPLH